MHKRMVIYTLTVTLNMKLQVPSVYDATEDLHYLDMIIQEALRHYSLFPRYATSDVMPSNSESWAACLFFGRVGRRCVETCVLNNLTIPEGTNVVVPVDLIHCLHTFWGKPDSFEPERYGFTCTSLGFISRLING